MESSKIQKKGKKKTDGRQELKKGRKKNTNLKNTNEKRRKKNETYCHANLAHGSRSDSVPMTRVLSFNFTA